MTEVWAVCRGPDGEPSLIIKVTGLCCGSHRALTDAVYVHCTNMHAHILNTQPGTSLSEIQMWLFSTIQFEDCGQSHRGKKTDKRRDRERG